MKKLILVFAVALVSSVGFSQSIFDKFEELDDVSTVVVNKNMFKLLAKLDVDVDDPEAKDFMDIATSITGLRVFATENKGIAADMKATVSKYLKKSSLSELMRVKDKDVNIKFYIKEGRNEDHVSELLMFVSGLNNKNLNVDGRKIETVLLTLTGDIDLNKISSLTNKMNLPKELNKVKKGSK